MNDSQSIILTAIGQKTYVSKVIAVSLVPNGEKSLLGFFVMSRRRLSLGVIEIETVDVGEVGFYGIQVDEHVFELTVQEVEGSHALPAGYGVALRCRSSHELEILLGYLYIFLLK